MGKRRISVVITDLDNTLYDWFEFWSRSFGAMLDSLAAQSGLPKDALIGEIKKVHVKHRTSEYALLIQEIPLLRDRHPGEDLTKVYAPAIAAYRAKRDEHLRLYPGVLDTLRTLKGEGCLVVGYTESQLLYTEYRIRALGLDGLLDYFYSPPSHDLPAGLPPDQINFYPTRSEALEHTVHRPTPKDEVKPNPGVLLGIVGEIGAEKEEAVYVGDNRVKDIWMAQQAGVADVYAAYGDTDKEGEAYQLLRRVTHWPEKDVKREMNKGIRPTYTLRDSFDELLELFEFVRFSGRAG